MECCLAGAPCQESVPLNRRKWFLSSPMLTLWKAVRERLSQRPAARLGQGTATAAAVKSGGFRTAAEHIPAPGARTVPHTHDRRLLPTVRNHTFRQSTERNFARDMDPQRTFSTPGIRSGLADGGSPERQYRKRWSNARYDKPIQNYNQLSCERATGALLGITGKSIGGLEDSSSDLL